MELAVICAGIGAVLIYWSFKFYRRMNWEEAPEPTPDFAQMHKRQAELLHIQDVLEDARAQGKLSTSAVEEYNRFCENELSEMKAQETAFHAKKAQKTPPA